MTTYIMKKIKNLIKKYIKLNNEFNLTLHVSSISFYSILSISTLAIIIVSFLNVDNGVFKDFLITQILEIIGETFNGLIDDALNKLSRSKINIFLVVSVIYSSSSLINRFNKFSDSVYSDIPKRNPFKLRLSSISMFLMLVFVFIFELIIVIYSDFFINNIIIFFFESNNIRFIFALLEFLSFYLVVILLNMYLPPIKISFKNSYKTSIYITLGIYLALEIFKLLFVILFKNSKIIGLTYVFVIFGFLMFLINYIICLGIIFIKKKNDSKYYSLNN